MSRSHLLSDAVKKQLSGRVTKLMLMEMLGTSNPKKVAKIIEEAVAGTDVGTISQVDFAYVSFGLVFGIELTSGERICLKVLLPGWSPSYVRGARRLQRSMYKIGWPAPEPITELRVGGGSLAWIDEWLAPRCVTDAKTVAVREILASGLAEFVTDASATAKLPTRRERVDQNRSGIAQSKSKTTSRYRWPSPPNPRIVIREADELPWLLDCVERAHEWAQMAGAPPVTGHGDWRLDNVAVGGGEIRAVYDWDSTMTMDELGLVAGSAALHTVRWSYPARDFPSAHQAHSFVAIYERQRGKRFTSIELQSIRGRILETVCVIARHQIATGSARSQTVNALRAARNNWREYLDGEPQ